jgi:hypothetical protein
LPDAFVVRSEWKVESPPVGSTVETGPQAGQPRGPDANIPPNAGHVGSNAAGDIPVGQTSETAEVGSTGSPGRDQASVDLAQRLSEDCDRGSRRPVSPLHQTWMDGDSPAAGTIHHAGIAKPGQNVTADDLFARIVAHAENARAKARSEARFEIRTGDGERIRVKMYVDSNVVTARISVSSVHVRGILASHAAELNQKLEMEGLVPQDIAFCLFGDNGGGSQGHGGRRSRGGKVDAEPPGDMDDATLVDTNVYAFEKWA